ncbi:MAG TPA: hypothetical protein PLK08_09080 [Phycisphaerae bacterium]|nr:hypothetical protein [Phycisphaerae bacterium]
MNDNEKILKDGLRVSHYLWLGRVVMFLMLIIAGSMVFGGCAAVGWFASLFPTADLPAQYEIPKDQSVLVLVEDPKNIVTYSPIKYELARSVNKLLEEHKACSELISPDSVLHLKSSCTEFSQLSTAEIGKKLDADLVLYIQITTFQLKDSPYDPVWNGKMGATVRVISVNDGRLWPKDTLGGYPVDDVVRDRHMDTSDNYTEKLSADMAEELAQNIGELFYPHPAPEHTDLPKKQVNSLNQP